MRLSMFRCFVGISYQRENLKLHNIIGSILYKFTLSIISPEFIFANINNE
jgi:hypothetical protein